MTAALTRADLAAVRSAGPPPDGAQRAGQRSLLRFISCGSVDDGKSTLIGRLLFDSGTLPEDQITALRAASAKSDRAAREIDYSLLLDGLAAEREQGITIDVAYRYFSTPRRSFIVADTPGHDQYTRNMATGASTAELAVILIDARKGVLPQTRRHSLIVDMLGVRHIVLAVNKMDLVGHSAERFHQIDAEFRRFASALGFASLISIPMAAKLGENVREPAASMPWYRGPTLLEVLEGVETGAGKKKLSARFVVQWVNRSGPDFRGFSGWVAAGRITPGATVCALPSGATARIARIVTYDGDLAEAHEGQSVTVTLDREIDVSRGNVLAADDGSARATSRLTADLLWMSNAPYDASHPLLLKIGARTVPARLRDRPHAVLDVETGARRASRSLMPNDIAAVEVLTDAPIIGERYGDNRDLGGFVLIDRKSNETVALGLVQELAPGQERERRQAASTQGAAVWLDDPLERPWRSLAKAVSWRTTGSLDTFVLAYLLTGHLKIAAGISLAEVVTKLVLYYLHERIWARLAIGRAPATDPPLVAHRPGHR